MKYLSCSKIEHGLVFDHLNVLRDCSITNSVYDGRPVIYENYYGETIDWNDFFEKKRAKRLSFKNGEIIPECTDCIGLENKEWDEDDYIDDILLTPWSACNSNCIYCKAINSKDLQSRTKLYKIVPIIKDMMSKNILRKNAFIDFAGGEPTIYEEFEELLNLFLDYGIKRIIIHSNAINISQAILRGIEEGVIELIVSVDAGTKELHKKVKRVDSHDIVLKNLKLYADARNKFNNFVKTKYVIVPGINDDKIEILIWLKKSYEAGIKNVILNLDNDYSLIENNDKLEYFYQLMQYAKKESKKLGIELRLFGELYRAKKLYEKSRE